MADLRTDYKDDVLNINTNERRKYRMINNADGTVSFEDVTDYVQNGDSFGSADVNTIAERVNRSLTGSDVVDNLESTATDLPLSANMGREIINKFNLSELKEVAFSVNTNYATGKVIYQKQGNIVYAYVLAKFLIGTANALTLIPENSLPKPTQDVFIPCMDYTDDLGRLCIKPNGLLNFTKSNQISSNTYLGTCMYFTEE